MRRTLLLALAGTLAAGLALAATETVGVIVKRTALRRDRQFYAAAVKEAEFGDRLTVLGREKDWIRVQAGGPRGGCTPRR
jgi:phage gp46-like protein